MLVRQPRPNQQGVYRPREAHPASARRAESRYSWHTSATVTRCAVRLQDYLFTLHERDLVACPQTCCGAPQGMQHNPGMRTIEAELMGALAKAGAISPANAGKFDKVQIPPLASGSCCPAWLGTLSIVCS